MTQAGSAAATVTFIDEYCQLYEDVFPDVWSFEHFKQIQIGMLSEIKRKTLRAIGKRASFYWILYPCVLALSMLPYPWMISLAS